MLQQVKANTLEKDGKTGLGGGGGYKMVQLL